MNQEHDKKNVIQTPVIFFSCDAENSAAHIHSCNGSLPLVYMNAFN